MSKWTKEQSEVISHRKGNLLVSAAAGSGKTAVLVEHVIDRLLDKEHPISLSSVVLMTFTEAAAFVPSLNSTSKLSVSAIT